jgi:Trypsin-like peptidase domain
MFVNAIERAGLFTRPVHSILRLHGHNELIPGAGTLFFVNEQGCAITCKHIADLIIQADTIYRNYQNFLGERRAFIRDPNANHHIARLETKYSLKPETVVRIKHTFVNCVDHFTKYHIDTHPTADLALIRFEGYGKTLYDEPARFLRDSSRVKPGRSLCRLGYPFPEFSNFAYNPATDDIDWTSEGRILSPHFPIDGIITRLIADGSDVTGIEMSTPGLRGQSGGPLFDTNGTVFGMQSSTRHLHLGFDIENLDVLVNGRKTRVSNYPFLNVGQCVHLDVIKQFLRGHNVKFYEE